MCFCGKKKVKPDNNNKPDPYYDLIMDKDLE